MLFENLTDLNGQEFFVDVDAELTLIEALFGSFVTYKEMGHTYSGVVRDVQFVAERLTDDGRFHQGVCIVVIKVPGA